ncbi:nitrite extrusion protein [Staphylococcus aureus]|nr:nitrite extrusion protein [Staphylococcus aureus]
MIFKLVPTYFTKEAGVVNGIVSMMGGLGGFFPPLIITFVTSLTGSNHLSFALLALFGVLALLMMMHMSKIEKRTV